MPEVRFQADSRQSSNNFPVIEHPVPGFGGLVEDLPGFIQRHQSMKHKLTSLPRFERTAAAALALLSTGGLSQAALTLKYTFNDISGTTVPNTAPGATINGTLTTGGSVAPIVENGGSVVVDGLTYSLGDVVRFAPPADNSADANTPYIQTGGSLSLWGITGGTPYTAMAWVKFNNQTNDNMIFGDLGGNRLHLGSRGASYHSGHWGDDVGGGTTQPGVWHHVAYTNDSGNNQTIYVDGVAVAGPASNGTGGLENGDNVVLGTSGNEGSLNGSIDDVKVFNSLLTPAEIQTEMTSTLIPPSISIFSATPSTTGSTFKVTLTVLDGAGGNTVTLPLTGVNFNGAPAASFSATKSGGTTTVEAEFDGAYIPGQSVYTVQVLGNSALGTFDLSTTVTGPILPPVASLPVPASATPSLPWAVREYTTTAANAPAALGIILTNSGPFTDSEVPVINFVDPQAAGDGGDFNNNLPFPGNTAADDNHIILARSAVVVAGPTTLSFNLRTDDGCALKITGATCTAAFGAGIDPADASTVINQGVTSARVTYTFPAAGTYDVGFMQFDGGGGGSAEVSWAAGAVTSVDERQLPWALVGNPTHPSVPPTTSQWPANLPGVAGTAGNWGIRTYPTEGFENVESLAAATAFLSKPEVVCWTEADPAVFVVPANWRVAGSATPLLETLDTPHIVIPSTPAAGAQLVLKHQYNFEPAFDGGVIEYSIDDGPFVTLPLSAFTQNGYNGTPGGLTNIDAWTAASPGVITSIATIPGVTVDNEVVIRFKGGWDNGTRAGTPNWEIRSVKLNWGAATVYDSALAPPSSNGGLTTPGTGVDSWTFNAGSTTVRTGAVDSQSPTINFVDPNTNSVNTGTVMNATAFPANTALDDNHFVQVAHTRINITSAGDYTFNARGDDGFLLRVRAVSGSNPVFRRVSGGGARTMSAPNEMYFPAGTGDSDTRGIITLAAGEYDLDYVHWEGVGGFWYQLTVAEGAFIDNEGVNGTINWVPVGHLASNTVLIQPSVESQWTVEYASSGTALSNNASAEALLSGASSGLYDLLNFNDPQSGGPGRFPGDVAWPGDTAADDNNFAMRATGYLHIEQEGDYLLGFEGDDGGFLEISGSATGFTSLVENATGAGTIQSTGIYTNNRLNTDVPTGNSRTTGRIHLIPGDYPITVLFFEIGGGAYWEVYGSAVSLNSVTFAKGTNLALLRYDASYPAGIPTFTPDNLSSPALTAQPTSDLSLALASFSFGSGDNYSISFPSTQGLSYKLEYSTDLVTWNSAGAVYGGPGASTTFNGLLTELSPPLPATAARVYWRVTGLY